MQYYFFHIPEIMGDLKRYYKNVTKNYVEYSVTNFEV